MIILLVVLIQCPSTDGKVFNFKQLCDVAHASGSYVAVATDLLSLALILEPGHFNADIAVGAHKDLESPLDMVGLMLPFLAARGILRKMPGRII